MIQLGCNYSKELIELIKVNKVELDWIKLSTEDSYDSEINIIKPLKKGLFHIVPYVFSNAYHKGWDLKKVNHAIRECQSPHVGVHLRANKEDLQNMNSSQELKREAILKILEGKRKINCTYLIENMPITCLQDKCKCLADPEFIYEVCQEAEIGLLLDLSHLKISAWYRGESEISYLKKLPLNLVKEIHINGPRKNEDGYHDAHQEMREEDYTFLEKVISLTNPNIITLEYGSSKDNGTDIGLLEKQLVRLHKILKS